MNGENFFKLIEIFHIIVTDVYNYSKKIIQSFRSVLNTKFQSQIGSMFLELFADVTLVVTRQILQYGALKKMK